MKRNKKEDILLNTDNDDISMLAEIQTDPDEVTAMEFNKEIPVMPLRNMVMFPSVVMPVTIGRPSTLKLINAAYKKKLPIAVVCQIQGDMDDLTIELSRHVYSEEYIALTKEFYLNM
jgi:ATP-dependent Lon protease